jgi:hypothetical protein
MHGLDWVLSRTEWSCGRTRYTPQEQQKKREKRIIAPEWKKIGTPELGVLVYDNSEIRTHALSDHGIFRLELRVNLNVAP